MFPRNTFKRKQQNNVKSPDACKSKWTTFSGQDFSSLEIRNEIQLTLKKKKKKGIKEGISEITKLFWG